MSKSGCPNYVGEKGRYENVKSAIPAKRAPMPRTTP
jgi:hypothetical protein